MTDLVVVNRIPNSVWPFVMQLIELGAEFEHVNRTFVITKGKYFRAVQYADIDEARVSAGLSPDQLAKMFWERVCMDYSMEQQQEADK